MATDTARLIGPPAAVAYVAVSAVTILGSIALAPWFDPLTNALSDLGAAGRATALLFNGGLIVGGLVGVAVAGWLVAGFDGVARVGGVLFGVTMCLRAGIGLFPVGTDPHTPIAISYFLGLTVALLVIGVGHVWTARRADGTDRRLAASGVLALAAGKLVPAVWLTWGFGWQTFAPGLAVPEVAASLGLLAWLFLLARRPPRSARG